MNPNIELLGGIQGLAFLHMRYGRHASQLFAAHKEGGRLWARGVSSALRRLRLRKDAFGWATLISERGKYGKGREALSLYNKMREEGVIPNTHTFVAALKACGTIPDIEAGKEIHSHLIESGCEEHMFVASTLVDMYTKCGSIEEARLVFENVRHRDVVSWNAIITGYVHLNMGQLALQLYARMQHEGFTPNARTFIAALQAYSSLAAQGEGKEVDVQFLHTNYLEPGRAVHAELAKRGLESDIFVASALVDMYARCRSIEDARRVFDGMKHRDVASWNAMITGYAQMDMGDSALKLYARMQDEGFTPNFRTYIAALKACGCVASLETGKEIHSHIRRLGLDRHSFLATCLLDMYGKCGSMVDAQCFFDSLPIRDSAIWNALLAGYSGQGNSEHFFALYNRMQQECIAPDDFTFRAVLTICSYNGLVDKGQMYFMVMCLENGVLPSAKHYSCIVDLLARAGQLDEAATMVKKMPFKPDLVTWTAILGACQKWNNVETGRNAFQCALMLDKKFSGAHVLMENIYVSAQMSRKTH